jgi:hypothetical protein
LFTSKSVPKASGCLSSNSSESLRVLSNFFQARH